MRLEGRGGHMLRDAALARLLSMRPNNYLLLNYCGHC
jgi:hypothetical protein